MRLTNRLFSFPIGLYLKDLILVEDESANFFTNGLINFEKAGKTGFILQQIQQFQNAKFSHFYQPIPVIQVKQIFSISLQVQLFFNGVFPWSRRG